MPALLPRPIRPVPTLRRRLVSAVVLAALVLGTVAATSGAAGAVTTNRPNASVRSLGLAVDLDAFPQPVRNHDGSVLFVPVPEQLQGSDLNGDGDVADLVLHVVEVGFGAVGADRVRNLGLALAPDSWFATTDEAVAFLVGEASQRQDLNGDGDTEDRVLHVWDDRAAEVAAVGVAVTTRVPDPVQAAGTASFAAVVEEAAQGADLNGDGDLADDVLHLATPRRAEVTSTGRAHATTGLYSASGLPGYAVVREGVVAFLVDEAADGRDANGDGDQTDDVVLLVDDATGHVTSTGIAAHGVHPGGEGLLVIEADEAGTGADLDGDGQATGAPVLVSDGTRSGTVATGLDARPDRDVLAGRVVPSGPGAVVLQPYDDAPGPDRLYRFDADSGTVADTGRRATRLLGVATGQVAFLTPATPTPTLGVIDTDGAVETTPVAGTSLVALGSGLVGLVRDGGFLEPARIASVVDVASGAPTPGRTWSAELLEVAADGAVALGEGAVAVRLREHADGPRQAMLDGDTADGELLPGRWDLASGDLRTLDVGARGSWATADGDLIVAVDEAEVGDQDGDGDSSDVVLVRARFGPEGDAAGPQLSVTALETAPGETEVTVVASSIDGSPVITARLSGDVARSLTPDDGVFDSADERFRAVIAAQAGQTVCVLALDADGDRSDTCVEVAVPDTEAPTLDVVTAAEVHPGRDLVVQAVVDDTATGGSVVTDATAEVDGRSAAMAPRDGAADSAAETFTVVLPAPTTYGEHTACVTATDDDGNVTAPVCRTFEVRDLEAPTVTSLSATPDVIEEGGEVTIDVVVDDTDAGASAIDEVAIALDGAVTWRPAPVDGTFDEPVEEFSVTLGAATAPGDHEVCVTVEDTASNRAAATCRSFTVVEGRGPTVRDVSLTPATVGLGERAELRAELDERATGGATIAGADWTLDGAPAGQLTLDEQGATVTSGRATLDGAVRHGTHQVCVTGTDSNGHTTAEPACATLTVVDDLAPTVTRPELPATVGLGEAVPFTVTASDHNTGGSAVTGVRATLDGQPIDGPRADDGAFDEPLERATGSLPGSDVPGDRRLCVVASDAAGNTSAARCAVVEVVDTRAPVVDELVLPVEVPAGEPFAFSFTADDRATGGGVITTARVTVHGAAVGQITTTPADGALDEPFERITGEVGGAARPGLLTLCVQAVDAAGNASGRLCGSVEVLPRVVTGAGSIASAYAPASHDATFALDVVEQVDGRVVGELTFDDGVVSFAATSISSMTVAGSTTAVLTGSGLLWGRLTCDFTASVREGDAEADPVGTFDIAISSCGTFGFDAYDSGTDNALTAGSVSVQGA